MTYDDNQGELAADIRTWLEWQGVLGLDVWPVEDLSAWQGIVAPTPSPQRSSPKNRAKNPYSPGLSPPPTRPGVPSSVRPKSPPPASPNSNMRMKELGGAWGAIMQDAPKGFQPNTVSIGRNGLEEVRAWSSSNCGPSPCLLGAGRSSAPVMLLEAHPDGLGPPGLDMLGKMREHVLRLPRASLFWLPVPLGKGCGQCMNLCEAQLRAVAPRAVLVMGDQVLARTPFLHSPDRLRRGELFTLSLPTSDVPALWTHHPRTLLAEPRLKAETMGDLQRFRGALVGIVG